MGELTFSTFLEQKEQELANLTDIQAFIKNHYPHINVAGLTHDELVSWMKKEGLIRTHGVLSDRFHQQMRSFLTSYLK